MSYYADGRRFGDYAFIGAVLRAQTAHENLQATIQIGHWGSRYAPPLHPRRRRKLPPSVLAFRLSLLRLPLGPAELGAINPAAVHDHR